MPVTDLLEPELVDELVAERRAHARVLERDQRRDSSATPAAALEDLVEALELRTDRYTLRRIAPGAYEARTYAGDAGFGASLAEAVQDLLAELAA